MTGLIITPQLAWLFLVHLVASGAVGLACYHVGRWVGRQEVRIRYRRSWPVAANDLVGPVQRRTVGKP